ncbi:F-box domain-containing protein [Pleurotus pulmonarius]
MIYVADSSACRAHRFSMNDDTLCGLTTLPQEILELLLCEMDWKDVLSIRATCTVLCFASQSRAVWRVQYQRVSDSYDTPLNAMDGNASYAELERDTLHWARLQHNWVSQPKQPTQRLLCECPAVQIHLVHGGRWLLASTKYPCLEVYDLDSLHGQRRFLIRSQDKHDEQVSTFVVDEVRMTPPNVDLFIALNHCKITGESLMRVSIWRLRSASDGHTLVAQHITSFGTQTSGVCPDMELRGDYFATNGRSPNHIDIYDWRRSSSLVHHKATIDIGENKVKSIRILSGRRILTFEHGIVRIYAIDASEFRPTPGRQPVVASPSTPLHTLHLPGMDPYLLCPLHLDCLGTASLYLACARAVVKLTVPYDDQPLIVADYLAYNEGRPRAWVLTLHRAYFRRDTKATTVLLTRGYHDEHCTHVWDIVNHNYDAGPLVDDYSGRIVERAWMNYKIVVFLGSQDAVPDILPNQVY